MYTDRIQFMSRSKLSSNLLAMASNLPAMASKLV